MTGRYAAKTTTPVSKSRDELPRTLARHGATETLLYAPRIREAYRTGRMPDGLQPSLAPSAGVIELPERAGGRGR